MEGLYINHLAVFVCAVANLALGALWYSPMLFSKAWQSEAGLTDEQLARQNPAKTYGLALLLSWIMAYNLAFFLGDSATTPAWGVTAGFLAGFGWATLSFVIIALFEQRSWRYMFINGGFITVYFTLIGFILGIWR